VSEIGAILISRLDLAVPALVAVFGLWLTALSIQAQTRNSRIEKIADVLMDCTQRFHGVEALRDSLEAAVRKGDVDVEAARERYFEAYWHFQWDQWNYFKLGLIPHEIYADWFFQRIVLMRLNHKSFGVIFEEGWRQIARPQFITYVDFCQFVDAVLPLAHLSDADARVQLMRLISDAFKQARSMRVGFTRRSIH